MNEKMTINFKSAWFAIASIVGTLAVLSIASLPTQAMQVDINVINTTVVPTSGDKPSIVGNNIVRLEDSYPDVNGYRIDEIKGNDHGRHNRSTSLFNITLQGKRYGHSIDLRGKLGKTVYNNPISGRGFFTDGSIAASRNEGCSYIYPTDLQTANGAIHNPVIDPGNMDMTQDCKGNTAQYTYNIALTTQGMQGQLREVFLDLQTLVNSETFQQLPPDLYSASTTLMLESWSAVGIGSRPGGQHPFPLSLTVNIRKQAYFSGITLPSTNLPLSVTYTGQSVQGSAATPIILQGSFDPQFGQIRLNARSDNAFSLRSNDQEIPYQAHVILNQQRLALNQESAPAPTITVDNLNVVNQVPLTLEVNFNRQRTQVSRSGRYSDRLTLVAEVPLV